VGGLVPTSDVTLVLPCWAFVAYYRMNFTFLPSKATFISSRYYCLLSYELKTPKVNKKLITLLEQDGAPSN
jgi:hypothetical protein